MRRMGSRRIVAAALLLLAAGCSRLIVFDTIVPKDGGTRIVARGAAFAPGPRGKLDVYAPAHATAKTLPIIVFFYGGSWRSGTRDGYAFVGRALAARGFLVVIPDYRLVPEVRFPAFLEDNAAAVRWVRGHAAALGGDPDRIVLAGHSAGAYDAAMLALDPRWLGEDRAAVRGFAGLAGPYDFLPLDPGAAANTFGQWPDTKDTQPVHFASTDDPPAMVAAGAEDRLVRPANSTALAARLRASGVAVEQHVYPRIGHIGILTAIARPFRARAPALDDLATFATRVTR